MTGIKIQQSKFLLFPELSSGEAGEKNYINFNHALSGRNGHNGTSLKGFGIATISSGGLPCYLCNQISAGVL